MEQSRRNNAAARADLDKPGSDTVSHLLTLDLSRAESLAAMLAHSRASQVVELSDLVAGMYLYDWDRLARYWEQGDHEKVESLLRTMCRISPERWNYWIQLYDKKRRVGEKGLSSVPLLRRFRKEAPPDPPPGHSADLTAILKIAEGLAPFRGNSGGRNLPILTSECVLLCIVRSRRSEISRRLAASGVKMVELERDALSSRRARRED
jgi:hypothetical protein